MLGQHINRVLQKAVLGITLLAPAVGCVEFRDRIEEDIPVESTTLFGRVTDGYTKQSLEGFIVTLHTKEETYELLTDSDGKYAFPSDFPISPGNTYAFEVNDEDIFCYDHLPLEECVGDYHEYAAPITIKEGENKVDVTMIHFDPMDDTPYYDNNLTYIKEKGASFDATLDNCLSQWVTSYPLVVGISTYDSEWEEPLINDNGLDLGQAALDAMAMWNEDGDYFVDSGMTSEEINDMIDEHGAGIWDYIDIKVSLSPELVDIHSVFLGLYDNGECKDYKEGSLNYSTPEESYNEAVLGLSISLGMTLGHLGSHGPEYETEVPAYLMGHGDSINPNERELVGLAAPDGLLDRNMNNYWIN